MDKHKEHIKTMPEEELIILRMILAFKIVEPPQIAIIRNFGCKHIDPTIQVCNTCSSQIRAAHQRISSWAERYAPELLARQESIDAEKELEKLKLKEEHKCVCGEKIERLNTKYCGKKCRDEAKVKRLEK